MSVRPWRPEHETDYDGPLSSRAEWHALAIGVEAGLRGAVTEQMRQNADVQKERHYFSGGYAVGRLLDGIAAALD